MGRFILGFLKKQLKVKLRFLKIKSFKTKIGWNKTKNYNNDGSVNTLHKGRPQTTKQFFMDFYHIRGEGATSIYTYLQWYFKDIFERCFINTGSFWALWAPHSGALYMMGPFGPPLPCCTRWGPIKGNLNKKPYKILKYKVKNKDSLIKTCLHQ